MNKLLCVAFVLVSLVIFTEAILIGFDPNEPFVDCQQPNDHLKFCDTDSICAWNNCDCPGGKGCKLQCTPHMGDWCNSLNENAPCIYNQLVPWRCTAVGGKKGGKKGKGKGKDMICQFNVVALLFLFIDGPV